MGGYFKRFSLRLSNMIPKIIHQIWLGDRNRMPKELMKTWKETYPTWKYMLWTEDNLPNLRTKKQFDTLYESEKWNACADLLRYELLYNMGGWFVDADSIALRAIPDKFLNNTAFAAFENETIVKGFEHLVANGYLASEPGTELMKKVILNITEMSDDYLNRLPYGQMCSITGPYLLTSTIKQVDAFDDIKVFPSYYFMPTHYSGIKYEGYDSYADQLWGTLNYDRVYKKVE